MNFTDAIDSVAVTHPDDFRSRANELARLAVNVSIDDLKSWKRDYEHLIAITNSWSLWGAAFVIGEGCSDDGFLDFRTALPAFGMERVNLAISDPDSLADLGAKVHWLGTEGFHYPLNDVFREKGLDVLTTSTDAKPTGIPWVEDKLPVLYPRLWELCSEDEDLDTLIGLPGDEKEAYDTFFAFVSCYLVMTDALTKKKQSEYKSEIAAMKASKQLPDYFWRSIRTKIKKDWISPKMKGSIFGFVCDGFSYCSSFVTFQEVFGVSTEGTPLVEVTWANYDRFAESLNSVINNGGAE